MKIAFRADASVVIGAGHVMRCLTLADRLRAEGADIRFLCRPLDGHLGELISARGYEFVTLPLREDLEQDAQDCLAALSDQAPWDWLVVDHYGLGAAWERVVRGAAKKILVIDDLADRSHECELLLDQNLQPPGRYSGRVPADCITLLGPRYALLRPQFEAARKAMRPRKGRVSRLLIFYGGSDAGDETCKALGAIRQLGRADLAADVVVGPSNPHRAAIEAAIQHLPNATLHSWVEDMATLMVTADLFVGAGGTSSWERCCLGLPALVLATADNQIAQCEALARAGAQLYLGPSCSVDQERLARSIEFAIGQPELLKHMAEQGQSLVDGRGVGRVADHLLVDLLRIRRAEPSDSALIHAWRNHPDTRRHAFDPTEIERERHERWFARVLADPNRELLVAEQAARPIGVLRYDIAAGQARVSAYLVPGLAGQGWGRRLMLAGERWLRVERPDVTVCAAEIAAANTASMALFDAVGFRPYRTSLMKDIHGNC